MSQVELIAKLVEAGAAHDDKVAVHQRRLMNEEGAKRAETRAQSLRVTILPLVEYVEEQKRIKAVQRAGIVAEQNEAVEIRRDAKRSKSARRVLAKISKSSVVKSGDAIRHYLTTRHTSLG